MVGRASFLCEGFCVVWGCGCYGEIFLAFVILRKYCLYVLCRNFVCVFFFRIEKPVTVAYIMMV